MNLQLTGNASEIRAFLAAPRAQDDAIALDLSIEAVPSNDLLLPQMQKLDNQGDPLADNAGEWAAVVLPVFGLIFAVETLKASNWENAKKVASQCKACGFNDWRLPTDRELQILIRRDLHAPAIDAAFFPGTKTDDWYWTATPHAAYPDWAWGVGFSFGYVNSLHRDNTGYVRAVRRVPAGQ